MFDLDPVSPRRRCTGRPHADRRARRTPRLAVHRGGDRGGRVATFGVGRQRPTDRRVGIARSVRSATIVTRPQCPPTLSAWAKSPAPPVQNSCQETILPTLRTAGQFLARKSATMAASEAGEGG